MNDLGKKPEALLITEFPHFVFVPVELTQDFNQQQETKIGRLLGRHFFSLKK
jgi:hypothetical protein